MDRLLALFSILAAFRFQIAAVVIGLLILASLYKGRENLLLWWINFRHGLPAIGRVASLGRKKYHRIGDDGFTDAEKSICRAYIPFYSSAARRDGEFYQRCKDHLLAVDEVTRSPMPIGIWFLTAIMLFADAVIFMYLIAQYVLVDGSEFMAEVGAVVGAFLVAIVCVTGTHASGQQLYKIQKAKNVRTEWRHAEGAGSKILKRTAKPTPENRPGDPNYEYVDAQEPIYIKQLNRLELIPQQIGFHSILGPILMLLVVLAIAGGSTYARLETLSAIQARQVVTDRLTREATAPVDVPEAYAQKRAESDMKAEEEIARAERYGSWSGFIVLAVVYIALQAVATYFGYAWGFAGRSSKPSWRITHRFDSREEFEDYYRARAQHVAAMADRHLAALQQRVAVTMEKHSSDHSVIEQLANRHGITFDRFLDNEAARRTSGASQTNLKLVTA